MPAHHFDPRSESTPILLPARCGFAPGLRLRGFLFH